MRLGFQQLKKMIVETLSGTKLGKVDDIIFDIDEQMIVQYQVKHTGISGSNYLINRDQVARFEEKKMIVYDTVIKRKEKSVIPQLPIVPESGMAMRNNS